MTSIQAAVRLRAAVVLLASLAAAPALAQGGAIAGRVEAIPAKYLPETVVYLKSVPGARAPRTVKMDQQRLTFVPHVLAITEGDAVRFLNHDAVAHNVYSPEGNYNLGTFAEGEERVHTFTGAGVYTQLCSLHPDMLAYVFVGQNPYSAVVDAQGGYRIDHVPPGTYRLAVWNSHLTGPETTVTVSAGATTELNLVVKR
jgi:plastocyanin